MIHHLPQFQLYLLPLINFNKRAQTRPQLIIASDFAMMVCAVTPKSWDTSGYSHAMPEMKQLAPSILRAWR
jgi:hypothetical protein